MKIFTTSIILILSAIVFAQKQEPNFKSQQIDSLLQESHKRGIFNGNALVVQNDTTIYNDAVGFADASQSHLLKPEMRFMIGSISKEFDGVGIMMLQEQGKLSLNDNLSTFFPQLPEWAVKISVQNLLQYSSGLLAPDFHKVRTDAEVWKYLKDQKELKFEPGKEYDYNNLDVFLRKKIIEKISGESYKSFVQKNMLKPLNMQHTIFDPTATTANFTRSFDESYVQDDLETYITGWIATNTEDMLKWVQGLNSGEIISKESLRELTESFSPSSQSPMGTSVYKDGQLLFRYHHGQNDNFEAGVAWIPDTKTTIILLTNNRCNELGDHISAIDAILRGEKFEIPKRSIELSLRVKIFHEGLDTGMKYLDHIRKNESHIFNFEQEEKELVNTGTWLLEKSRTEDGLKVLELAAQRYPESTRAANALAEAKKKVGSSQKNS